MLTSPADLYTFAVSVCTQKREELERTVRTGKGLVTAMGPHQGMFFDRMTFLRLGGYDTRFRILADRKLVLRLIEDNAVIRTHYHVVAIYYTGGLSSSSLRRVEAMFLGHRSSSQYVLLKFWNWLWALLHKAA